MKVIHSATNSGACRDGIKIKKIRNNQKCPCESGKKYKKCCKKNVILNKADILSWALYRPGGRKMGVLWRKQR
tara:strand:+ start:96 stop:314 length:219 start_codon:yes stop_codon:yes gene_type:complete